jgi:hypothetical protein
MLCLSNLRILYEIRTSEEAEISYHQTLDLKPLQLLLLSQKTFASNCGLNLWNVNVERIQLGGMGKRKRKRRAVVPILFYKIRPPDYPVHPVPF